MNQGEIEVLSAFAPNVETTMWIQDVFFSMAQRKKEGLKESPPPLKIRNIFLLIFLDVYHIVFKSLTCYD